MDLEEILDDWFSVDKTEKQEVFDFQHKWFEHVLQKAIKLEGELKDSYEQLRDLED